MSLLVELERLGLCKSGPGRDPTVAREIFFAPRGAPTPFEIDAFRL